jgi:hypothetical protein
MSDDELEIRNRNSAHAIANLEGQVAGLDLTVSLLTQRLAAAEQREFMYQIAGLVLAWFLLFSVAIVLILSD